MTPSADAPAQMRWQKALLNQGHRQYIFHRRAHEFLVNHAANQKTTTTLSDKLLNHLQLIRVKEALFDITENQSFILVELFL